MSSKLDALTAHLAKSDTSNQEQSFGEHYPFWQMKGNEQAVIRFLPDADENNPLQFLVEKHMHTLMINGQRRSVPCTKMYGDKECPICDLSSQYYKEAKEAEDAGNTSEQTRLKALGKKYWRNKQHVARALIVKDPLPTKDGEESHEGQVRTVTISYQIYQAINLAFSSGDLDELPSEFEGGCDFIIKKQITKDGAKEYASYVYSSFARKCSDLDPASVELKVLADLLPEKMEYSKLEELLAADVTGTSVDSAATATQTSSNSMEDQLAALKSKTTAATTTPKVETPVETPEAATTTSDEKIQDDADAILNSILEGRK